MGAHVMGGGGARGVWGGGGEDMCLSRAKSRDLASGHLGESFLLFFFSGLGSERIFFLFVIVIVFSF